MFDRPPDLSPREIVESGLLHVVNERFFWPLGLTVMVTVGHACEVGGIHEGIRPGEEPDWSTARLSVQVFADEIETGLTPEEHRQRHRAFEAFERGRKAIVMRSDEPDPIEGDGSPESDEWAAYDRTTAA